MGTVPVSCFACSPDGRTLASGDDRGEIRLWDLETGRCLRVLNSSIIFLRQLVFSPDGKILAAASWDRTEISVWDIPSGQRSRPSTTTDWALR